MPVSANASTSQCGFTAQEAETFGKLVALFDSSNRNEAESAFRRSILMCAKSGQRFCDAVADCCGLAELQVRFDQRERDGEQLADALGNLQQEYAQYRRDAEAEVGRLSRGSQRPCVTPGNSNLFCGSCERKRRILAVIAGLPIAYFWFRNLDWSYALPWQNMCGIVLTLSPLLGVVLRWRWLHFKQKYSWVSRKDNDIYRAIAARWNGFLQRLSMN